MGIVGISSQSGRFLQYYDSLSLHGSFDCSDKSCTCAAYDYICLHLDGVVIGYVIRCFRINDGRSVTDLCAQAAAHTLILVYLVLRGVIFDGAHWALRKAVVAADTVLRNIIHLMPPFTSHPQVIQNCGCFYNMALPYPQIVLAFKKKIAAGRKFWLAAQFKIPYM